MNEVVIRIFDTDNNVLGDVDLAGFKDFPLAITKGIVNLDNLKARTGTYTKKFKVPNTKNNSNLFSSVDNINSRKDYRDALNRKPCAIFVNNKEIERGFIQVSRVYEGFELDSFELVFFGNNIDWVKQASGLKINDIGFRTPDRTYTTTEINTVNNTGYSSFDHNYPYISRGGNNSLNDTEVEDYYPCFYIKSILEKGLNQLGWNLNSNFFSDADIETLTADLNGDMKVAQSVIDASKTRAATTGDDAIGSATPNIQITYDDDSTPPNEDSNNNYDLVTHSYTVPSTGGYTLNLSTIVDDFSLPSGGSVITRVCVGTGTTFGVDTFSVDFYAFPAFGNQTSTKTFDLDLVAGDVVSIFVSLSSFTGSAITANVKTGSYFDIQRKAILSEGDSFSINELIPDDYYLLDVINDVTRMFNLYYWTDTKTKTIYVETRDSFFKPESQALNWTDKLSIDKKYEIDYVSSYKRNVTFGYKDLDSDEWLKGWQKVNKRKYAEYNYVLPDRFAEGTTNIKLDLFSAPYAHVATEATPILGSSFDINRAFVSLKVWNEYKNDGTPPEERIESYNPKIFFYQNGSQQSEDGTNRIISLKGATTFANIPYGIFETYSNINTPKNLSFTDSVDKDGNLDSGLFSVYYSNMLKNIEEGGRLIGYFNLTDDDIENLDFRKLVYIDGPDKAKGYYLIESVIDYKPIENNLTKVSLFKFENLGSVPVDSGQQGNNGNNNNDNGYNPPNLQPIYVEDGSQLIEVWIENPITGNLEPVYK